MNETEVKQAVKSWLGDQFQFVQPEFPLQGGRLDFVAGRWVDEGHHLDIVGVECKGETNVAELVAIANGQLARYSRSVPKLYFACSMPGEAKLQAFVDLCRVAGLGFMGITSSGVEHVEEPPTSITARLDWGRYLTEVRCRVALFLTFQQMFGKNLRAGANWRATPHPTDKPQWNVSVEVDERSCYYGVNIENAKPTLKTAEAALLAPLIAGLPGDARCDVGRVKSFGPGKRAYLPLWRGPADLIVNNLHYLKALGPRLNKGEGLYLWIGVPVWARDEALSQAQHREELECARAALEPLYLQLGGKPPPSPQGPAC